MSHVLSPAELRADVYDETVTDSNLVDAIVAGDLITECDSQDHINLGN